MHGAGKIGGLLLVFLLASVLLDGFSVQAGVRTLVVPEDYANLSDAIANAKNGDTIFIKEGVYEGPINQTLQVNKSLSIVGENAATTTINLYPAYTITWILTASFCHCANALEFNADNCKLANLTIVAHQGGAVSATGNGLQVVGNNITSELVINGSHCNIIENVVYSLRFTGNYSNILRNSRADCLYIAGASNIIQDNVCQGIDLYNATNNVVCNNRVWSDSYGYSGIELTYSSNNALYRNRVSGFSSGFRLWFSHDNLIVANEIYDSSRSFNLGDSSSNKIYLNSIENNGDYDRYVYDQYADPAFRVNFPTLSLSSNHWDNGSVGNYWNYYNGTDLNGDGIGDVPFTFEVTVYYYDSTDEAVVCGTDNFPLTAPINIDHVNADLPQWVTNVLNGEEPETPNQPAPTTSNTLQTDQEVDHAPLSTMTVLLLAAICLALASVGLLIIKRRQRFRKQLT